MINNICILPLLTLSLVSQRQPILTLCNCLFWASWWLRQWRICLQSRTPGSGRSPGEGHGYPLQYSCLESSVDRGASGYSPWTHKELDTTKWLTHTHRRLFLLMATSTSLNNKQKWPFLDLSTVDPLTVSAEGQEFNSCFTGSFLFSPSSCYNYLLLYICVSLRNFRNKSRPQFKIWSPHRSEASDNPGRRSSGHRRSEWRKLWGWPFKKIFHVLNFGCAGSLWCVGFLYFQRAGATP